MGSNASVAGVYVTWFGVAALFISSVALWTSADIDLGWANKGGVTRILKIGPFEGVVDGGFVICG